MLVGAVLVAKEKKQYLLHSCIDGYLVSHYRGVFFGGIDVSCDCTIVLFLQFHQLTEIQRKGKRRWKEGRREEGRVNQHTVLRNLLHTKSLWAPVFVLITTTFSKKKPGVKPELS